MTTNLRTSAWAAAAMTCFIATASVAQAGNIIPAGPGGPGTDPGVHQVFRESTNPATGPRVDIGPLFIAYDESVGPMEKWLYLSLDRNGDGAFNVNDRHAILAGLPVWTTVHETLVVGSDPAWRDWHEEIITDGWAWGEAGMDIGGQLYLPERSPDGRLLWWDFPAQQPGTQITIWKDLLYLGFGGDPITELASMAVPDSVFPGNLRIEVGILEHPTIPEPSTIALLGVGLFALIVGVRRRTK